MQSRETGYDAILASSSQAGSAPSKWVPVMCIQMYNEYRNGSTFQSDAQQFW